MNLKDIKSSYPVQMAEYAVHRHISGNPAFAWWIRHVLAKRNCIIGKLKSKYWVERTSLVSRSLSQCKSKSHVMRRMEMTFGGTPYKNKRRTSGLLIIFGRKTYQSCRQDIKRLYVIKYLMSIWAKTLEENRDLLQMGTRLRPR